jgi:hypothetical protein
MESLFKLIGYALKKLVFMFLPKDSLSTWTEVSCHAYILFCSHWYNYSANDIVEDRHPIPEHPRMRPHDDNMNAREVL